MDRTVAVVGTLDTKALEIRYLKDEIEARDCGTLIVDVGVFPQDRVKPDVGREEVARAAGWDVADMLQKGDRSLAVKIMMEGGARLLKELYDGGRFSGIVALGGGTGTHIATGIMRGLPIGVPKIMVSTVAARDMSMIIGSKDITIMHAVADIAGLNFITRKILAHAAGAIVGMGTSNLKPPAKKSVVAMTSFGPLNQAAFYAKYMLEELGYEVVPFHAIGPGSMAMEDLVDQGVVHGVLDLALHEFADQMYAGYCGRIGPQRLETPGRKGIPHVILPGGLDMIAFECTSPEGVPEALRERRFLAHDFRSFVRTNTEDLAHLAEVVATKLNKAVKSPTVVIPLDGWSKADSPGGPYYEPDTNRSFVSTLKACLSPSVRVVEVDANINNEYCARRAVTELHTLMQAAS